MPNQEVTKTETNLPTGYRTLSDLGFEAKDILIPRLMLAQNTSEAVGAGAAKLGDIYNSLSGEVLGGGQTLVELVPLHVFKTWRIYNMSEEFRAQGGKLIRVDAFTAANADQKWEGVDTVSDNKGGTKQVPVRRDLCYNAFVLLVKELTEGFAFPANVIFKRTSLNAGKQVVSQIYKLDMLKQPIYSRSFFLTSEKTKGNGPNMYAIFQAKPGTVVSPEHQKAAAGWADTVRAESVRVDDTEASDKSRVVINDSPEDAPF